MDSILTSIKKLLGIAEEYENFDSDIIMHINSVLFELTQIGVGPSDGFMILDKNYIWSDFIPADFPVFEAVKSYIYLKVKLLFDPPQSSAVIQNINAMIDRYEWRLNIAAEMYDSSSNGDSGSTLDGLPMLVIGSQDRGEYLVIDSESHNIQNMVENDRDLTSKNYSYEIEDEEEIQNGK